MHKKLKKFFIVAFITSLLPLILSTGAYAWWNEKWEYRKRITFDTTPAGADIKENLIEIPVLLRLHTGNFDFTKALDDGMDIRFVRGDDKTILKHHIEHYDTLEELALLWVKVPMISAGANQDFIWMYYGNRNAVGGQDPRGTYDINQLAVYHFSETEGNPSDSTAYENSIASFMGTQGLPSIIGNGINLNGVGDRIMVPPSPSLSFKDGFTLSLWLKVAGPQADACLFTMKSSTQTFEVRIDDTKIYGIIREKEKDIVLTEKTVDVAFDAWHHIAMTVAPRQQMAIFLDGLKMTWLDIGSFEFESVTDVVIGSDVNGEVFFAGDIDEIRVSNIVRSEAWIRSSHAGQGPDSLLTGFGEEEMGQTSGMPVFYLATIARNISLDGLVIIGILALFSLLSWIVMFSKGFYLWLVGRGNRAFIEPFNNSKDPAGFDVAEDSDYESSPLYRIYLAGLKEYMEYTRTTGSSNNQENPENPEKTDKDPKTSKYTLEKIKSSLERAYINETQGLNSWIVLLTMAITGGPFLGLLGTVWGVMNTFAALAEAGEANIMAIAPGVASALATTVFGLIVAIPALFGYNYLASRIKSITNDMDLFMDEFTIKLEQAWEQEK